MYILGIKLVWRPLPSGIKWDKQPTIPSLDASVVNMIGQSGLNLTKTLSEITNCLNWSKGSWQSFDQ